MDNGYKFEELINSYLGKPTYNTYSTYWDDKNDRVSLLYTSCLIEYDENSTGKIGGKLQFFMEELFNDKDPDKKISIECLIFLRNLKKLDS